MPNISHSYGLCFCFPFIHLILKFCSVQWLSRVQLFATPWTAGHQSSLYITNSRSLLKLMSIESVMPFNHLILCCPHLLLPSIFPSIRILANESALRIRWPKYWSLDECNCAVVWALFGITFLWDWKENWPFPVPWPLLSFPNLLAHWVQHFQQHHLLGFERALLEFHHLHKLCS